MDGLLVVDKPSGPTSHDVVASARRALHERRIGHTGTLDPLASGVLPLVLGRATRLARFLSASDKEYEATVRLGFATDTGDAQGQPAGPAWTGALPGSATIVEALGAFRGTFLQQPPAFSAKKIGGQRSYAVARAAARTSASPQALPAPVPVTVSAIDLMAVHESAVRLRVVCSAGFYVRALAHDLGARLGTGGHLEALRRVRSGDLSLADALPFADLLDAERGARRVEETLIPMGRMLPSLPAITLTPGGVERVLHGQDVRPQDLEGRVAIAAGAGPALRLMDAAGALIAIGEPSGTSGLLHPAVVLV